MPTIKAGELDNFTYLLENTIFSNNNNSVWAWWLETFRTENSTSAWGIYGEYRFVNGITVC